MSKLYDRAEIYDLIDSEKRTEITRKDWKQFLGSRPIRTFLDVSIGTGSMTLPLQELGVTVYGSDLSESPHEISAEKLLVDIVAEKSIAATFSPSELPFVFENIINSYRIDMRKLNRYAGRRGKAALVRKLAGGEK